MPLLDGVGLGQGFVGYELILPCCEDFFSAYEDSYFYVDDDGVAINKARPAIDDIDEAEEVMVISFCPFCGDKIQLRKDTPTDAGTP